MLQLPDHVVEDGEVHGERVAAADDVVRPEGGVWFHWRSFKQLISVLAIVNIWLSSKKGKFEVVWALDIPNSNSKLDVCQSTKQTAEVNAFD